MAIDRVKFQDILESQLPNFMAEDFPLLTEFLRQYYVSQEVQSSALDISQNLDQYIKLDQAFQKSSSTVLESSISFDDDVISAGSAGNFTNGFPDSNGLIKIDDEVIFYATKTDFTFEGCVRGFSGVTDYTAENKPDQLVFSSTDAEEHTAGATIENLSVLFLKSFLKKLRNQYAPGFGERTLDSKVDQRNFILGSKGFYQAKGTKSALQILFQALYGVEVDLIRPSDFLLRPSDANYKVEKKYILEAVDGDPLDLKNRTLFQTSTGARGSVSQVESILYGDSLYYIADIDSGFDRDINVSGSIFGEFKPNPKTKVINTSGIGASIIDVDSTLSFDSTGELTVLDPDGDEVKLTYDSKNSNQFLGVTGLDFQLEEGDNVSADEDAFSFIGAGQTDQIRVKINASVTDLKVNDNFFNLPGDQIKVKSYGAEKRDSSTRYYFQNIKTNFVVKEIQLLDAAQSFYRVTFNEEHFFSNFYNFKIYNSKKSFASTGNVIQIVSSKQIDIRVISNIPDLNDVYFIENQIIKGRSTKYLPITSHFANIQNIYTRPGAVLQRRNDILVASNSIPNYDIDIATYNKKITISGIFNNTQTIQLTTLNDHLLYTGDAVFYKGSIIEEVTTTPDGIKIVKQIDNKFDNVNEGVYYVKRIDSTKIKLARGLAELEKGQFVKLNGDIVNNTITYNIFNGKNLDGQSILRQIPIEHLEVETPGVTRDTSTRRVGILNNGVEVLNYVSDDKIFYGSIKGLELVSHGDGYDIINPPIIHIDDQVGTGATGVACVTGELKRIDIEDPGFGYIDAPTVSITGGNGIEAEAETRISAKYNIAKFNSKSNGLVSLSSNTIGFTTHHRFSDGELVIYENGDQTVVGGLSTDASYYVKANDANTISLFNSFVDAIAGINTISLTSFGNGEHQFRSSTRKNFVTSIVINNHGKNFSNKRRIFSAVGVNTATNTFSIKNHGYKDKEYLRYSIGVTTVSGLEQNKDYFVINSTKDSFQLCEVGAGNTFTDYFYDNNFVLNIVSNGDGSFNYKPIQVTLNGTIGVTTFPGQDFTCKVQPIFRGKISSTDLTTGGVGYGSSEIINFDKQPLITLESGEAAELQAIVSDGKIVDVVVLKGGRKYNSPPDLVIRSVAGKGCQLTPIIVNGVITEVKVIKQGSGYDKDNTEISVISAGLGCKIRIINSQWTINLFEKNFARFDQSDGYLDLNLEKDGLQFTHLYAPRKLRENIYSISNNDDILYGESDLQKNGNVEIPSTNHSPIIGWAYDGHPIYGPYGYGNKDGTGGIRRMKSSYETNVQTVNRPNFVNGFFIEDFEYTESGDLDEHNGRFCITPDFPKGVYAYFMTINNIPDTIGPFENNFRPVFPYVIGPEFKANPDPFNYNVNSSQLNYDIESNGWQRITNNYYFESKFAGYDYIFDSNKLREMYYDITATSRGEIQSIDIIEGGDNYRIGDKVILNNEKTSGFGALISVNKLKGKQISDISVSSSLFENVEFNPVNDDTTFVGIATVPHSYKTGDIVTVSGISSFYKNFDGAYRVGISSESLILNVGVATDTTTGLVTYFNVVGRFSNLRENDFFKVENEIIKILNVDEQSSRIRVLRNQLNTSGAAHSSGVTLSEQPRKIQFNVGIKTSKRFSNNKEYYFNPSDSVGVGTYAGIGITLTIENPGSGPSQVNSQTRQIYIPNHGLKINQKLSYDVNGGTSLKYFNGIVGHGYAQNLSGISTLFVAPFNKDFIGLSSNAVGYGTTGGFVGLNTDAGVLYFTGVGAGSSHSFTTINENVLIGNISKNTVTVSTATTHGLRLNDKVEIKVTPSITETIDVRYNDFNRRIVFNPHTFTASDVSVANNTVGVGTDKFRFGDRVIHTSSSPSGGLINQEMYYVVPYDSTNVRFVRYKSELNNVSPNFVNITSASSGTLSRINPPVNSTKNNNIIFDLSDSSLSFSLAQQTFEAFELQFFINSNFDENFYTTFEGEKFEVLSEGKVGIDTTAKTTLSGLKLVPEKLFYKFVQKNKLISPDEKNIVIDETVDQYNQVNLIPTEYDGTFAVSGIGSTTFSYSISKKPEVTTFNKSNSNNQYTTNSKSALGSIDGFAIESGGKGYRTLPGITSISSKNGSGAIIETNSTNIGNILTFETKQIGFNLPTDKTLSPTANIPQQIKIDPLFSFEKIGISSGGLYYVKAPNLVVLDGVTNQVDTNVELKYNLNDSEVTIIKNTFGLNNTPPRIIPVDNSNGVGISSITFDNSTKKARVYLNQQFSTFTPFPFSVGNKVIVENVNVGVGSTGLGYNSENYNYELFELTSVDAQLGGSGAYVEYSMESVLNGNDPGEMDIQNSIGRVIPEYQFPIFNPILKSNDFFEGETVIAKNKIGKVERWNNLNGNLVVSTSDRFEQSDVIEGTSSFTRGPIRSVNIFTGKLLVGAGATVVDGWQTDVGFTNDNLQRIPNNEYYQDFSYSIRSQIPYETWNDPVSALNHTSGYAKFSDLQVISSTDSSTTATPIPIESIVTLNVDLDSVSSLHTKADFDTSRELSKDFGSHLVSDQIVFDNRVISDFFESIGNRVLEIDDVAYLFNSNARTEQFSAVGDFENNMIYNKIFAHVRDKLFTDERQSLIIQTMQDGKGIGYQNEYAKLFSKEDLGTFNFLSASDGWKITWEPIKFKNNSYDVSLLSFSILDNIVGVGTTGLGSVAKLESTQTTIPLNTTTNIASIATTYRSSKVLALFEKPNDEYFATELNIIHDGTNVKTTEYGSINNNPINPVIGFGTFNTYLSGGNLEIDFHPNAGVACTANLSTIAISTSSSTTGNNTLDISRVSTSHTSISASGSPSFTDVVTVADPYESAYFFVTAEDTTNNVYDCFEVTALYNSVDEFFVRYANVGTGVSDISVGQIGIDSTSSPNGMKLQFKPEPNIDVVVRTFNLEMQIDSDNGNPSLIDQSNVQIRSTLGNYTGTAQDLKTRFNLLHNTLPIFRRDFAGADSSIVNVADNQINIPNHFFVTGERVTYRTKTGTGTTMNVGITQTNIPGIGLTDKLPDDLYVVKVDEANIRFATSAENALLENPTVLTINSVGSGSSHSITSRNQDTKCLVAIDNMIQSPLSETKVTSQLTASVATGVIIETAGITSMTTGDLIQINDEIMKIDGLNVGGNNKLQVLRAQLGSSLQFHNSSDNIVKLNGNYRIVDTDIIFVDPPFGQVPLSTTTGDPDLRNWAGITTNSTFQGRSFLKNAPKNTTKETYYNNYVFDDISNNFNGITTQFTLTSSTSSVTGISTDNAIILINNILQLPQGQQDPAVLEGDYELIESSGETDIVFLGEPNDQGYDQGAGTIPTGGQIISVGSTEGFGYQPLVSAGGTAIISGLGTVQSVSIGNSGSGYRSGIQTVNVGVCTHSLGTPSLVNIGIATVLNGHVIGVAITNPGTGYTTTNPPFVVFDDPLNYSNIPLIYSSSSASGVGTEATIDIQVGQGSSIIDFQIDSGGYGFGNNEILTVAVGGTTGIPTNTSLPFREFQITVEEKFTDKFNGWSVGQLQVFDNFDDEFDGVQNVFRLQIEGTTTPIQSRTGSLIDVEQTLIIFINGVLQKPGEGYFFRGGSLVQFSNPPKKGDTSKVLFYKGGGTVDVVFNEVPKTIKVGDDVQLINDPINGQTLSFRQDPRTTIGINTIDTFETNPYDSRFSPGVTADRTLSRITFWTKQLKDLVVNGENINKDRPEYEPDIFPSAFIISSVGIGSTNVFVDSTRPLFASSNENTTDVYREKITLISQNTQVSASATVTVSAAGTITSFNLVDGGVGYAATPSVSIAGTATGIATLTGTSVSSITVVNPGGGYTSTSLPVVLVGPPAIVEEEIGISTFAGDNGNIVGLSTQIDGSKKQLVLDLHIPEDSFLRSASYIGSGTTVSNISATDFFIVRNSNVELNNGIVTSLGSDNSTIVGVTTTFIDCVFQVESRQQVMSNVVGLGTTSVIRVEVNVNDITDISGLGVTNFYGQYSWGRVDFRARDVDAKAFDYYGRQGSAGISTSALLTRSNPLKSSNYIIV